MRRPPRGGRSPDSTKWPQGVAVTHSPVPAASISARLGQTLYPEPFARQVSGRLKRKLGEVYGLKNFGVNLTHLAPGAASALAHHHSRQDEFIFVVEGTPTLVLGDEEYLMQPGDCCGF